MDRLQEPQIKYTHRHPTDGNVAIGKLSSSQYIDALNNIAEKYLAVIEDKTVTTHHTYYTDLTGNLKTDFERIQFSNTWYGLCSGAFDASFSKDTTDVDFCHLLEMNEIYYSNPKPNFANGPLYGAAANLIPHRDCILFCFPGIRVYRAIICATDGNSDTATEFINHGVERQLNKGDYMVFDFDRTLHQVKKTGQLPTPRILLKLHFLITSSSKPYGSVAKKIYVKFASLCYIVYYRVARYTEQLGTDPTTFVGFFFGILWEYPFYPEIRRRTQIICAGVIANRILEHTLTPTSTSHFPFPRIILYSTVDMMSIYLCIVFWFFVSHLITKKHK